MTDLVIADGVNLSLTRREVSWVIASIEHKADYLFREQRAKQELLNLATKIRGQVFRDTYGGAFDDHVKQVVIDSTHRVVVVWNDEDYQWELWEGKPDWFGPLPFQWRDDIIQRASLVNVDEDPAADLSILLDDYVKAVAHTNWSHVTY